MESVQRAAVSLVSLYYLHELRANRGPRRWWVRPSNRNRDSEGYYETEFERMRQKDPEYFQDSVRMHPQTFDLLLSKVRFRLEKFSFRKPISPSCRLFVTLMYLADGTPVAILARLFKMGETTVRGIILEVCEVLWDVLKPEYLPVPTEDDWSNNAAEFSRKWNFPNCCAAIDGKHVAIQCPANAGSQFFNHKGFHSIVLLALCNANYEFLIVDIGAFGGNSDGGIFSSSEFGKRFLRNEVDLPRPSNLPNSEIVFPYYIVGDAAFPLKTNLMRPYPGMNLPVKKDNFNTRLSVARRTIENAFGILVSRWRILGKTIDLQPENVEKIIQACVVLHNFVKRQNSEYNPDRFVDQVDGSGVVTLDGEWRSQATPLLSVSAGEVYRGNNSSRNAYNLRDILADYVMQN